MHMRIDAMKVAAAVLTASNCRETLSIFTNYTSSKGVSMETVETPLDPPLGLEGAHYRPIAEKSQGMHYSTNSRPLH